MCIRDRPKDQLCVWVYGLFTDKPGDYIKKPMRDCTGKAVSYTHLDVYKRQVLGRIPNSTSGATGVINPVAWQPGTATRVAVFSASRVP